MWPPLCQTGTAWLQALHIILLVEKIRSTVQGCGGMQPDLPPARADGSLAPYCYGCCQPVGQAPGAVDQGAGIVVRCPDCRSLFCFDCDAYIHEQLHNCPGCECLPPQFVQDEVGSDDN